MTIHAENTRPTRQWQRRRRYLSKAERDEDKNYKTDDVSDDTEMDDNDTTPVRTGTTGRTTTNPSSTPPFLVSNNNRNTTTAVMSIDTSSTSSFNANMSPLRISGLIMLVVTMVFYTVLLYLAKTKQQRRQQQHRLQKPDDTTKNGILQTTSTNTILPQKQMNVAATSATSTNDTTVRSVLDVATGTKFKLDPNNNEGNYRYNLHTDEIYLYEKSVDDNNSNNEITDGNDDNIGFDLPKDTIIVFKRRNVDTVNQTTSDADDTKEMLINYDEDVVVANIMLGPHDEETQENYGTSNNNNLQQLKHLRHHHHSCHPPPQQRNGEDDDDIVFYNDPSLSYHRHHYNQHSQEQNTTLSSSPSIRETNDNIDTPCAITMSDKNTNTSTGVIQSMNGQTESVVEDNDNDDAVSASTSARTSLITTNDMGTSFCVSNEDTLLQYSF
jgi:hypothetical protein